VKQVVLVAHRGCAYYGDRLGIPAEAAETEQRADLHKAGAAVQRIDPGLEVAAFFTHVDGAHVWFQRVYASPRLEDRLHRWRSTVRA
jgi:hypothetical protein